MNKILVVGSCVFDMITTTREFPEESQTVLGEGFNMAPGGKGANQAYQIGKLDRDVSFIGKLGKDQFKEIFEESLKSANVDVSNLLTSNKFPTGTGNVILHTKNDHVTQNRIIVVPSANMDIQMEDILFLENTMNKYQYVVLQFEIPMDINKKICEIAKKNKVKVILNPAPADEIPEIIYKNTFCICPNEKELHELTGADMSRKNGGIDLKQVKSACEILLNKGVENVVVTLGEDGVAFMNRHEFFCIPCIKVDKVIDPTAAGDSFIGAYVSGLSIGFSTRKALEFANIVASMTVQKLGAQMSLPSYEEVKAYISNMNIKFEM